MTIEDALLSSKITRLDAEVLLADLLELAREKLLAHPQEKISNENTQKWHAIVERRKQEEPVAYITGKKEFYGREFIVTPDVLIPRPATEGLIDLTLDFLREGKDEMRGVDSGIVAASKAFGKISDIKTAVDIGTGSGCVAITLKLERPELTVIATDISKEALEIAKQNAALSVVNIQSRLGYLLEPVEDIDVPFVVVSNPPYIPEGEKLPKTVSKFEPPNALFSGTDGMDIIRELLKQCQNHLFCRGIVLECKRDEWLEIAK